MLPIIKRMKATRNAHLLSQDAVAKALGVSRLSVTKWENGECTPRESMKQRIDAWILAQRGPVDPQISQLLKQQEELERDLREYVRHVHCYHEVVTHAIEALQQYNKVAAHQLAEETTRIMGMPPVNTKETGADNPFS